MSVTEAVKALADLGASFFDWAKTASKTQTTRVVVSDKRDLKKAVRYAEEAFDIVAEYGTITPDNKLRKYETLVKKFRRWE